MNNDPSDRFEELAKLYPELMKKSQISELITTGPGWDGILDAFCKTVSTQFYSAKACLKGATDFARNDGGKYINACEEAYATELANLPEIVTIKEKYGGLRIYVRDATEEVYTLIRFAEYMSQHTCEVCGAPGKIDYETPYVKTLCEKHSQKPIEEFHDGKVSAKIQDNDV